MNIDFILPVALGIGLAAAVGFRVFAPLLIMGLAVRQGFMPVSAGFDWVATTPALMMLAAAAVLEVAAYYIPGVDNLLDGIATPAAVAAGVGVSAAAMVDVPPMLKWTLAIIAGGGVAAATQGTTALLRGKSTVFTGGLGNHAISTGEIIGAVVMSALAIVFPYIAIVVIALLLYATWRTYRSFNRRKLN